MIQICQKDLCVGCGACKDVCPLSCINMCADKEGFLYPYVDLNKCVDCGKCQKVCPVLQGQRDEHDSTAYAVIHKDSDIRKESSSGGAFTAIARYIIDNGGVVFGATMGSDLQVRHVAVDNVTQLRELRGSKYVQSQMGQCYCQAKHYLENGRPVLFTGTPCQIAGLYHFLGKRYSQLFTQDIVCHGVPAPLAWKEYIKHIEERTQNKIKKVCFRDKTHSWRNYSVRFEFEDGTIQEKPAADDLYMRSFLTDLCLRYSCYQCSFKTKSRMADITLADFWGVEKCEPELDNDKGTSLVIAHSKNGQKLLDAVKDELEIKPTDYEKAVLYNSAMVKSATLKPERDGFMACLSSKGFYAAAYRYLRPSMKLRIKRKIKKILKW